MPLARLPEVSNPKPMMRMGARAAAPAAFTPMDITGPTLSRSENGGVREPGIASM